MAYIWGVLAAIEPAFRTVTDSSDPWIRALMKVPASLADLGLAVLMVYAFRATPFWAVVTAAIVLLHPAVIDVSAWWGQYESIYLLSALAALVFALNGRNGLAAAALALARDDQAAGAAVPPPVRGLVLGARRVAGDRPDRGDRAGASSSSCGCRSSAAGGPVGLPAATWPSTRTRSSRSLAHAIVLLHPAVIDVSAWWGQYESSTCCLALGRDRVRDQRSERAGPRPRSRLAR